MDDRLPSALRPSFPLSPAPNLAALRLAALALALSIASTVAAQVADRSSERSEALPPPQLDEIDASTAFQLEQSSRFLAESQWNDAVEALRRAESAGADKLIATDDPLPASGFTRYVPARQYCQWRLAALAVEAPPALAVYRRFIDPLAERWLRLGEQNNDDALLTRVVDQAFASRHGDDALLKLGDLALARGRSAEARAYWSRILPGLTVGPQSSAALRASVGSPLWLALRKTGFSTDDPALKAALQSRELPPLGCYPDTDLEPASVLARLVLASIFEVSRERAAIELQLLRLLQPEAEGELGGRRGSYATMLAEMLKAAGDWPPLPHPPDWRTLGGDLKRGQHAAREVDPAGRPLWSYPLPRLPADREWLGAARLRPADDSSSLLAYHPLVVGKEVFLSFDAQGSSYIVALDLKTGRPLWQTDYSRGLTPNGTEQSGQPPSTSDAHAGLARHVGVSRHTLSASRNKLFARLGSPVTQPSSRRASTWLAKDQGFLMGLDLRAEGKPLEGFPIRPPSSEWTFEGTPVVDEGTLYVAMRRTSGVQSQLHLAAFDVPTTPPLAAEPNADDHRPTGRLKWRTPVCSSQTALGGDVDRLTHLLVTVTDGRVYLNTNAGAVAAASTADGKLLWVVTYPRAPGPAGDLSHIKPHWFRDLTPCLSWKDLILVAPADCEQIFALHAASGEPAWSMPAELAGDVVHLLGVQDDVLLAGGDSLYWIDARTGSLLAQFPRAAPSGPFQAAPAPRGYGRGVLAGRRVCWPTRESIFVFDAVPQDSGFGYEPGFVREIPLLPRGASGGNLVIADGVLLIASGDRLVAFGE